MSHIHATHHTQDGFSCSWTHHNVVLQVTSVSQVWQNSSTQAIAYASTTHTAVSYRPLTSSSRPSTAHFSSPRAYPPPPPPPPA